MVFHEITEPAIRAAAQDTRELDNDLVDAQETRRILDRLYGYEVSPVLWKKVMPRLSAGRVQSVATRVIVQRERERMAFRSAEYWDILAKLDAGADARVVPIDRARLRAQLQQAMSGDVDLRMTLAARGNDDHDIDDLIDDLVELDHETGDRPA